MRPLVLVILFAASNITGCMLNSTYAAAHDRWTRTKKDLTEKLGRTESERDDWHEKADYLQSRLDDRTGELEQTTAELTEIDAKLEAKSTALASAEDRTANLSQQVTKLDAEKSTLAKEKERLAKDQAAAVEERKRLAEEVKELRRLRAASEARSKEYKKLLGRLAKMIDAGDLSVKIRGGRMLVTMPSDVLFEPAKADLKPEAIESIKELAGTLKGFKGRKFQVIGHSDSSPISNEEFASNWELSSARAVSVLNVLVSAGVPAKMLSAAGYADHDPVASNRSSKGKRNNRRVEIAFMPKIEELPGFDKVAGKK